MNSNADTRASFDERAAWAGAAGPCYPSLPLAGAVMLKGHFK